MAQLVTYHSSKVHALASTPYSSSGVPSIVLSNGLSNGVVRTLVTVKRAWKILKPRDRIEATFFVIVGTLISLLVAGGVWAQKFQSEDERKKSDFDFSKTIHNKLTSEHVSTAFERLKSHRAYQYFIFRKKINDQEAFALLGNNLLKEGSCAGQVTELWKKSQENPFQSCLTVVKSLNFVNICYFQMLHQLKVNISKSMGMIPIEKVDALRGEIEELKKYVNDLSTEIGEPQCLACLKPTPAKQPTDLYIQQFDKLISLHSQNAPFQGFISFSYKRGNMTYGHRIFFKIQDARYTLFDPGLGLHDTEHKGYFFELLRWSMHHRSNDAVFHVIPFNAAPVSV